jgi:hypothetical protein
MLERGVGQRKQPSHSKRKVITAMNQQEQQHRQSSGQSVLLENRSV